MHDELDRIVLAIQQEEEPDLTGFARVDQVIILGFRSLRSRGEDKSTPSPAERQRLIEAIEKIPQNRIES